MPEDRRRYHRWKDRYPVSGGIVFHRQIAGRWSVHRGGDSNLRIELQIEGREDVIDLSTGARHDRESVPPDFCCEVVIRNKCQSRLGACWVEAGDIGTEELVTTRKEGIRFSLAEMTEPKVISWYLPGV